MFEHRADHLHTASDFSDDVSAWRQRVGPTPLQYVATPPAGPPLAPAPARRSEPPPEPPPPRFDPVLAEHGAPCEQLVVMLLRAAPDGLNRRDCMSAAIGVERVKRMLDARGVGFQARAAGPDPDRDEVDEAAEELSCGLDMHPQTAALQVTTARALARRLPVTVAAMESGALTLRQATVVERALRGLDPATAHEIEAAAVPGNPRRLNSRLQREIARRAPEHAKKTAEARRAERSIENWSDPVEGVAGFELHGPLDLVALIKSAIDVEARPRHAGECRDIAARRFDTLLGWARLRLGLDAPSSSDAPQASPARRACSACGRSGPTRMPISVTVSLETLLRLTDAPGELEGYGPIPADVAREMAADGELRRWVTEETGKLLDVGARTYRPSAALSRYIRGRDRTCRFPSCDAPAVRCDLDHTLSFHVEGGKTIKVNLVALCRRHHRLKHETDWAYELLPNLDVKWTAPSGRVFIKEAETYSDDGVLSAFYAAAHRRDRERRERREGGTAASETTNDGPQPGTAEKPPF